MSKKRTVRKQQRGVSLFEACVTIMVLGILSSGVALQYSEIRRRNIRLVKSQIENSIQQEQILALFALQDKHIPIEAAETHKRWHLDKSAKLKAVHGQTLDISSRGTFIPTQISITMNDKQVCTAFIGLRGGIRFECL